MLAFIAGHFICAVPRPVQLSRPTVARRRDSESQLQSLVARVQCGDWPPLLTSLLRDRLKGAESSEKGAESSEKGAESQLVPRSIYRETLFLNMSVLSCDVDIGRKEGACVLLAHWIYVHTIVLVSVVSFILSWCHL